MDERQRARSQTPAWTSSNGFVYVEFNDLKGSLWLLPSREVVQTNCSLFLEKDILQLSRTLFTTCKEEGCPNHLCHKLVVEGDWKILTRAYIVGVELFWWLLRVWTSLLTNLGTMISLFFVDEITS